MNPCEDEILIIKKVLYFSSNQDSFLEIKWLELELVWGYLFIWQKCARHWQYNYGGGKEDVGLAPVDLTV